MKKFDGAAEITDIRVVDSMNPPECVARGELRVIIEMDKPPDNLAEWKRILEHRLKGVWT